MSAMGGDLLRWPVIGALLRWRHARTSLQIVLLAAAAAVVLHGLFGPPVAPANMATVLTWVHYRGLLVIALLAAGNLFCTGCPFILARDAGRRLHAPTRRWPRWLRTKWTAIALFVAVLFAYELFDLWALPAGTAYLVLAYFAAALIVDLVFTGATFCKYLCPIGQFNFMAASLSPLELRVREPAVCSTCRTFDCIKGRPVDAASGRSPQRGCELRLFLPSKVGNADCTFCLDCVQACPYDNVALAVRVPGAELVDARRRSGVGRFTERADIAALAIVFVFAALLNAFGMIAPVYAVQRWVADALGTTSELPALAVLFALGLCVFPLLVVGTASGLTRTLVGDAEGSIGRTAIRYAYALLPFGFGVWVAHYGFHLLTGAFTVVPVAQSAAIDVVGWPILGLPLWQWVGMQPGSVFPIQLGFIALGTMGSLAVAYGISERDHPTRAMAATAPWAAAVLALASTAVWILAQPMEMRGTILAG
jgi:polyferredoxin